MTNVFSLLLGHEFLQRALFTGVLVSLCCAVLGVSLVLKRISMIGDGLSHVGFGALAVACAAGVAPLYFSLPIVVIAAFLLIRMNENGKIKGDAAIALISTGALAIGVMATSLTTGMNIDIYNYMFGSILTMTDTDVVISVILALSVIILSVVYYNEIFACVFDESFAKATGTKTSVYNMLISALTAVTIVIGMRMMGAMLISSLIIFPTVISMKVARSYKRVVVTSALVSVMGFIIGLFVSVRFEAPTGASVVCVNIVMLGIFSLLGKIRSIRNGLLSASAKKLVLCVLVAAVALTGFSALLIPLSTDEDGGKLKVVATSFAPYDFSRQIAGDKGQVTMLLSPGEESHTFEPTPKDIETIENCDVFIYGGGESDKWVDTILSSVNSKDIRVVKMMDVTHKLKEIHEEDHSHTHEEEYDEHVWTSLKNAKEIAKEISKAFCIKDKKNADFYNRNAESYLEKITSLESDFERLGKEAKGRSFIIADRFPLRYLFDEFSLESHSAFPGCSAQSEANPVTLAFLTDKVKNENIRVIYKVDMGNGNVASSVSRSSGAEVLTLYSCHTVSLEDFESGETYISLMKRNLENLRANINN